MTTRTLPRLFSGLLALLAILAPAFAKADDSISGMTDPKRDYTIEGDVVTVWEDSFLFNDGTGQVIVDIRPMNTRDLDIRGRDYIQVTGHEVDTGIMRPLVMQEANREPVLFQGVSTLPPLPLTQVMRNTIKYRMAQPVNTAAAAPRTSTPRAPAINPNAPAPAAATQSVDDAVKSAMAQHAADVSAARGLAGSSAGSGGAAARRAPTAPAVSYGTPTAAVTPEQ